MINPIEILKNPVLFLLFICSCFSVKAGLNNFTNLIFIEEWLIERKIDLTTSQTKCRASIPSHGNWFGARIRLGRNNELIMPIWISVKEEQVLDSKLAKVKKLLNECRSSFLFLPNDL